jgi:cell fate regulator YaaT (PSP1 superfamily)
MPFLIGVMHRKNGSIYYYNTGDLDISMGERVICHFENTTEIGEVVVPPSAIKEDDVPDSISKVIRKATEYDLSVEEINRAKEEEGRKKFEELAKSHGLTMKLVDVHVIFDKSKMVFYFTADKRVDFREMVKELASYFKIRIELRQIGVRDEAKIVGGLGPCGMNLCCKSFLTDFESISIKMAKDQNLPLNPLKISGICGRLMCCLKYEYDSYKDFVDEAPEKGLRVDTKFGRGVIEGHDPLKKEIVVVLESENRVSLPLSEIVVVEGGTPPEAEKQT